MILYRRLFPFLMVIVMAFPAVVRAQTPDSTRLFTAADGRFSLYHPADWKINRSEWETVLFTAPIFGIG
ncbi:MAG: hypothetical protein K8I82_27670, partial [Anaerolineae bacterium]|nr:hypothetical protein [Anaerolineae bacterium]